MPAPDVKKENMQEDLHRRPTNLSTLINTGRCLLNPRFLICTKESVSEGRLEEEGREQQRCSSFCTFLLSPTAAPCNSCAIVTTGTAGLLGEFRPDQSVFHIKNPITELQTA